MAERPKLPLETQALIENALERARASEHENYPMVFGADVTVEIDEQKITVLPRLPKPATLRLQLRQYASTLFDTEAQYYPRHASSEEELRSWLVQLSICLVHELTRRIVNYSRSHDFHCSAEDRAKTLADALEDRSGHWVEFSKTDFDATMARATAVIARVKEVLERFDDPIATLKSEPLNKDSHAKPPLVLPAENELGAGRGPLERTKARLPGYVQSRIAAHKMEDFLRDRNIRQKSFALDVGCHERTLRRFRETGKIRYDTLFAIAREMKTTVEDLKKIQ